MKKLLMLVIMTTLLTLVCSSAFAASSRKGKKTYNKLCRSCHIRGGEGGRMAPSDKTISQWKRFVEKNKHDARPDIIGGMSEKERKNLLKFLQDYAADADIAETCG